jgi:Na+-transporting NADH:ubiquinone oxidoreductase subunit NqrD
MSPLSTKLSAFAAALIMNCLVMSTVGYLFALQSHPQMSAIAFAKAVATHQWFS